MPCFARPAANQSIGIAETRAGGRRGENTQAAAGCPGPDVARLDQSNGLAGPGEFDSADETGNARADDRRIARRRQRLAGARRGTVPPAGVRLNQSCPLGVYSSASSRVS